MIEEYINEFTEKEIKRKENGEIIDERKEMEEMFERNEEDKLTDIIIKDKDIEEAIDSIDENSSAGPNGVPAFIIKKTKKILNPRSIIPGHFYPGTSQRKQFNILPLFLGTSNIYVILKND